MIIAYNFLMQINLDT